MTRSRTASLKKAVAKPSLKDRLIKLTKTGEEDRKTVHYERSRDGVEGALLIRHSAIDPISELSSVSVVRESSQSSGP